MPEETRIEESTTSWDDHGEEICHGKKPCSAPRSGGLSMDSAIKNVGSLNHGVHPDHHSSDHNWQFKKGLEV